ncbi:1830_t:CDS:1 [Ambispora gerdemannii]|uniref:1830_t:CDS:1 n=1 Tax=Ambispora gerdemannii TaxID=144530 RepID=A0A9N9FRU5_9GLOM|nr:1830_t:CDS:1 [Ambispora gerdemannii]
MNNESKPISENVNDDGSKTDTIIKSGILQNFTTMKSSHEYPLIIIFEDLSHVKDSNNDEKMVSDQQKSSSLYTNNRVQNKSTTEDTLVYQQSLVVAEEIKEQRQPHIQIDIESYSSYTFFEIFDWRLRDWIKLVVFYYAAIYMVIKLVSYLAITVAYEE